MGSISSANRQDDLFHSSAVSESSAVSDRDSRKGQDRERDKRKQSDLEKKVSQLANHKKALLQRFLLTKAFMRKHSLLRSRYHSKELDAALFVLGLRKNPLLSHFFSTKDDEKDVCLNLLKEAVNSKNEKLLEAVLLGANLQSIKKRKIFSSKSYLINGHYLPASYPKDKILKR